jgi:hypothetical protein
MRTRNEVLIHKYAEQLPAHYKQALDKILSEDLKFADVDFTNALVACLIDSLAQDDPGLEDTKEVLQSVIYGASDPEDAIQQTRILLEECENLLKAYQGSKQCSE